MQIYLCSVARIVVVFHFPFLYYSTSKHLVWAMGRACTAVLASPRLFASHTTDHMQQTRYTPYEYCLQVSWHTSSVLFTTLTSQLKTNTRQQCCSPSDHTTHCAALYTAHCSYDTHNATILGDITAELDTHNATIVSAMWQRNLHTQQPTTTLFERRGKDRRSRSRSRYLDDLD